MWKIFGYKDSSPQESKQNSQEDAGKIKELRSRLDQKMKKLTMQVKDSQELFVRLFSVDAKEQALSHTFLEMMATLEGLVSIIEQLKGQYEQSHNQLMEFEKVKQMLSNHHNIVNSIQDSYNDQIKHLYEEKNKALEQLQATISMLASERQELMSKMDEKSKVIDNYQLQIVGLELQNKHLRLQNTKLLQQKEQLNEKYVRSIDGSSGVQSKKIINFECIKLQYIFYYVRLRHQIMNFLEIKDFITLKTVSKFYRHTLDKESPKYICMSIRNQYRRSQVQGLKSLKYYEKIYELFPSQNIKMNAFKYLYFKIKPASYILPYLQEDPEVETKVEIESKDKGKFNWRQMFTSDKNKSDKKEEGQKFTMAQLKNEDEYKKIEHRIEATFKNILAVHMPEDLKYFSQTMQKQLQELKSNLILSRNKASQTQWTAQLHCLSKFMYLEMNQLYNLVQVIFGELIIKNKDLIDMGENYQYLRENQGVLRTLIETVSHDKSNLEKKCVMMQNEVVKMNLQKEAVLNKYDQISNDHHQIVQKYEALTQECVQNKRMLQRYQQDKKYFQQSFQKIREELEMLEPIPLKSRKNSMESAMSEQQKLE